jgi:rod shape-determining protein MreB and related proteins
MKPIGRIGNALGFLKGSLRVDLAMDLGTANTLVYLKGKGVVVNEPSVVAIDARTGRTVAVGKQAVDYLGRTPPWIRAIRPLKDGVIGDFDAAMAMIKGFLRTVFSPRPWLRPRIVIGVPSGITQVEKRAVKDSAYEAGARDIFLLEEPMAAAMGAGLEVEAPIGNLVVDIGGGTTEVAVIALGATAYCESIRVAGDVMDDVIVRFIQKEIHLQVTHAYAEKIKVELGYAWDPPKDRTMTITGKEPAKGGPRSVELRADQITKALEEPVDAIIDAVHRSLESTPSTLLADIKGQGMILAGGGSLLRGMAGLIGKMTGIRATLAEAPMTSVVNGCGMAIEDPVRWKDIFIA